MGLNVESWRSLEDVRPFSRGIPLRTFLSCVPLFKEFIRVQLLVRITYRRGYLYLWSLLLHLHFLLFCRVLTVPIGGSLFPDVVFNHSFIIRDAPRLGIPIKFTWIDAVAATD